MTERIQKFKKRYDIPENSDLVLVDTNTTLVSKLGLFVGIALVNLILILILIRIGGSWLLIPASLSLVAIAIFIKTGIFQVEDGFVMIKKILGTRTDKSFIEGTGFLYPWEDGELVSFKIQTMKLTGQKYTIGEGVGKETITLGFNQSVEFRVQNPKMYLELDISTIKDGIKSVIVTASQAVLAKKTLKDVLGDLPGIINQINTMIDTIGDSVINQNSQSGNDGAYLQRYGIVVYKTVLDDAPELPAEIVKAFEKGMKEELEGNAEVTESEMIGKMASALIAETPGLDPALAVELAMVQIGKIKKDVKKIDAPDFLSGIIGLMQEWKK